MEKRTVITVAGAITLTVLASTSAFAVNFRGAHGQSPGDVGTFTPVEATSTPPQTVTVYVDVPAGGATSPVTVTAAPQPAVTLGPGTAAATEPITTSKGSPVAGNNEHSDNENEGRGDIESGEHDDD